MSLKSAVSVMVFVIALLVASSLAALTEVPASGAVFISLTVGWMANTINSGIQETIDLHTKKID